MGRSASLIRKTRETQIAIEMNLDGLGEYNINTGIGFFDHCLESFSRHSSVDMILEAKGDIHVDFHHTMEDTGIVLGGAIREACGDRAGISRFGDCILPMDETLVLCAIDLGGRPYLNFDVDFPRQKVGDVDTELFKEFFQGVSNAGLMNIHIKLLAGDNCHHIAEATFKAFARALRDAVSIDSRIRGIPSTKGSLV